VAALYLVPLLGLGLEERNLAPDLEETPVPRLAPGLEETLVPRLAPGLESPGMVQKTHLHLEAA
jgi:hypothetical protein